MISPDDEDDVAEYAQVELPQRSRDFIEGWNQAIEKAMELAQQRRDMWQAKQDEYDNQEPDGEDEQYLKRALEAGAIKRRLQTLQKAQK